MQALAIYAARYERAQGSLDLGIHLDGEELGKVTLRPASNEPVEVSRALKETDPGRKDSLTITPSGNGRFYYTARLSYSPKLLKSTPTNAGMEVVREYSVKRNGVWTLIKDPLALKQGELVRVDLFLSLSSPRSFVVVSDPIPGGLEPMNRDLATSSTLTNGGVTVEGPPESIWFDGREWIDFGVTTWGFYHKELRHASARFYSEFLPPGHYHLSYVSQAIASGEFVVLPTHAEEMYDPDVFGDSSLATLRVSPAEGP
jgi:uncharacterized protein YfaS (alpha-2-macroglobulin family)